MMNILYIMRFWPVYGGGETITVSLANEFIKQGDNVFVAFSYDKEINPMPYYVSPKIKAIKVHTIEHYQKNDVKKLHEIIKENKIDVMINQWGSTELCNLARKGTSCKLITCWHLDIIQREPQFLGKKDSILKKMLGSALFTKYFIQRQINNHNKNYELSDKYVFLSSSFEDEYHKITNGKKNKAKTTAISNPLTYNSFFEIANINKKKKQVLFVGRVFEYHKRLSYILKIWKNIENELDLSEWRLKVVGDGPDMEPTKKLAMSLGLNRISFEGFQNPKPYYEESSIFVMTSSFEGFGMTLIEAQQNAVVPIVMDSYSSLHDIITNGENGFIEPNNNLEQFTIDLIHLMRNPDQLKEVAAKGVVSCKKFSISSVVSQWNELFKEITCIQKQSL